MLVLFYTTRCVLLLVLYIIQRRLQHSTARPPQSDITTDRQTTLEEDIYNFSNRGFVFWIPDRMATCRSLH